MDFLSSGLFWIFFALTGIFVFIYEFGYSGRGILAAPLCQLSMTIGGLALVIVTVLSFIFMWWQGGVAILISGFIWVIIAFIVGNIIRNLVMRRLRGD